MYIQMYVCICMCVHVCVSARIVNLYESILIGFASLNLMLGNTFL